MTAGLLAAPSASAAAATATTLGPARTIAPGQTTSLTARVSSNGAAVPSAYVSIQYSVGTGWISWNTYRTWSTGAYTFAIKPSRTAYWRAVFVGNAKYARSYSAGVKVTVLQDRGAAVVKMAAAQAGDPYRYGAAGPHAFDCSGLTKYVFGRFGVYLPHSATSQASYGRRISQAYKRPGDLLLFPNGSRYYHAAIYAGNGEMWDASTPGKPVAKKRIWSSNYVVRRLV